MIDVVADTGSTSADLAARIGAGEILAEGYWLVADRQSAGRGRHGRTWQDAAGNFMGSTAVHLRPGDPPPETIAFVAGLAAQVVVADHVPQARLKWPNDVMAAGAKLAGVLLERAGHAVIVGIGVNLVTAPTLADRPAIALADLAGSAAPSRDTFARALASGFAVELARWRDVGLAPLLARWTAAAHPPGTPLSVDAGDGGRIDGTFGGLDAAGALLLRLPDGALRAVRAGEVRLADVGVRD